MINLKKLEKDSLYNCTVILILCIPNKVTDSMRDFDTNSAIKQLTVGVILILCKKALGLVHMAMWFCPQTQLLGDVII